jgi:hypothetical protein
VALEVSRLAEPDVAHEIFVSISFNPPANNDDFGFSIAGGTDNPLEEGDPSIFVTAVVDGGAVGCLERL